MAYPFLSDHEANLSVVITSSDSTLLPPPTRRLPRLMTEPPCGDGSNILRLESLFAHLPVDAGAKADVLARVSDPIRVYHGVDHLAALWRCHTRHASAANLVGRDPGRIIACAVAYHDLIYDSSRNDNELLSAQAWLHVAERCGVAQQEADCVAATIRATRDHLGYAPDPSADPASETLRLWFLDLDLAPLGSPPATFRRNARRLRRECPQLTDAEWADANLAFLRRVEAAPRIFRSSVLFQAYETRARTNIAAAIARRGRA